MNADWNKDAFLPFSLGARACPGRRLVFSHGRRGIYLSASLRLMARKPAKTRLDSPKWRVSAFSPP